MGEHIMPPLVVVVVEPSVELEDEDEPPPVVAPDGDEPPSPLCVEPPVPVPSSSSLQPGVRANVIMTVRNTPSRRSLFIVFFIVEWGTCCPRTTYGEVLRCDPKAT